MTEPVSQPNDAEPLSFEQALAEIEAIVHQLEEGQLGLEESLGRYERGVRLLNYCQQKLQQAERRIELLAGVDAAGNPLCTAMEEAPVSLEEKARQRSKRRTAPNLGSLPASDPPTSEQEP